MSYTRLQLRTATQEAMDSIGSSRWGDTLIDQVLSTVHARGWRRILNANRSYRLATRTVATAANGQVDLADLSDLSDPNAEERLYKVLGAAQGTLRYTSGEFMDNPLATRNFPGSPSYTFYRTTTAIQFLPVQAGVSIDVWVNHIPSQITTLANDVATVEWPDDYELIVAWEAAARLMAKGAAESDGTNLFQTLADDLWADLLADVARFTTDPLQIAASDSPADWGSV